MGGLSDTTFTCLPACETGTLPSMLRPAVVFTFGVALVAGCGGSKSSTPSSSTTSSRSGVVGTVSKSQATSYAHAVNLKPGDVPELTAGAAEKEASPKPSGEEAARCAGAESRYRRIADVNSARFRGASVSPRETLASEGAGWPTATTAARN